MINWYNQEVRDEKGNVIASLSAGEDITDEIAYKQELKVSEERFRIMFDSAPDAYYLLDLKGIILDGNKAAAEMTGYKKSDLIGKSLFEVNLIQPSFYPSAIKGLAKNFLGKSSGPEQFTLTRGDGKKILVESRSFPTKIGDKTVVLGIMRDVTAQQIVIKEMKDKNESFQRINKLMIGRELKMVKLKEEIARLNALLGELK